MLQLLDLSNEPLKCLLSLRFKGGKVEVACRELVTVADTWDAKRGSEAGSL